MGYLDGFGVIIKKWAGVNTATGARVTVEYPEEVRPKPERFHGRHVLNRYEDGLEKCIGCELCAGVCPAKCIYVRGADNDPEDPTSPGERFGYVYEINYLRCIHCDLCVEACPTEAITETKLFEFSFTNRSDAIYTKNELVVGDDGKPQKLPWENWDGGFDPAEDTSGWMRATSPGGDADFKGIIAWAGELGYGVRPPERATVLEEVGAVPSGSPIHEHALDHQDPSDVPPGAPEAPAAQMFNAPQAEALAVEPSSPAQPETIAMPAPDTRFSAAPTTSLPDLPPINPAEPTEGAGHFDSGSEGTDPLAPKSSVLGDETKFRPAKFDAVEGYGDDDDQLSYETTGTDGVETTETPDDATGGAESDPVDDTDSSDDGDGEVGNGGAGHDETRPDETGPDETGPDEPSHDEPTSKRTGYFDAPDDEPVTKKRRFFR